MPARKHWSKPSRIEEPVSHRGIEREISNQQVNGEEEEAIAENVYRREIASENEHGHRHGTQEILH